MLHSTAEDRDGLDTEPDDEPTYPSLRSPRARVLVVDDDADTLHVVTTKLRRDGYEVYEASSGDEALSMLAAMHDGRWPTDDIDLLVLDIHMPGRSGVAVLSELRTKRSTIPALFITGSPDQGLLTVAAVLGAQVLLKPLALDRLSDAAIKSILARDARTTS